MRGRSFSSAQRGAITQAGEEFRMLKWAAFHRLQADFAKISLHAPTKGLSHVVELVAQCGESKN
jgi:hypothetical protein